MYIYMFVSICICMDIHIYIYIYVDKVAVRISVFEGIMGSGFLYIRESGQNCVLSQHS